MRLVEVSETEFQNAEFLNQAFGAEPDEEILVVNRDRMSSDGAVRQLESWNSRAASEIIVWCDCSEEERVDFAEFLCHAEIEPVGYFIPSGLWTKTGLLNGRLKKKIHYEFLCRLISEKGSCRLNFVSGDKQEALTADDFSALAYILKRYLKFLYENSCTEKVLQSMSRMALQNGRFADFQTKMNLYMNNISEYNDIAWETAPFIVIMGDGTCGGVLYDFAEKLAAELVRLGQAVWKIDHDFQKYEKLRGDICKGVIGFQAPALETDFFHAIKGPKLQFWFDDPLYYNTMFRDQPEDYYVLCQDENYAKWIREHCRTQNAIQFPPAGSPLHDTWEEVSRDRPYDLIFIGSYFSDDISGLNERERDFYRFMLEHPGLTFEEGVAALNGGTENGSAEEMDSLKKACDLVIGHFRRRIIDEILDAGYDIHVYGESWNYYQEKGLGKLIRHPSVTPQEALTELSRAKIGLNVMSWHKAGMTERVANILLSGAVCLSEDTSYLREHFTDGKDILTFTLDRLEEIPDKIARTLGNEEYRLGVAKRAYEKAMKEHTWRVRAEEVLQLVREHVQERIEIYVATHVRFEPPENPIYIPLHVGREGKEDLGYLGDNTGNHISDLNYLYGELTGLFWIWQNVEKADYVGLCHYRRYFLNQSGREMQRKDYLEILKNYDAIVPKHAECEGSYYEHYSRAHNSRDLDAVEGALVKLYPEYYETYKKVMSENIFYGGNLMVTSLPILKAYAEWLFQIFLEASENIDVSSYDAYHRRVYGFLSEQMFYVFLKANNLSYCEVQVGISQEKAETKTLIGQLTGLLSENRIQDAKRLFHEKLLERPDLLLPGSDIHGSLQEIYEKLMKL